MLLPHSWLLWCSHREGIWILLPLPHLVWDLASRAQLKGARIETWTIRSMCWTLIIGKQGKGEAGRYIFLHLFSHRGLQGTVCPGTLSREALHIQLMHLPHDLLVTVSLLWSIIQHCHACLYNVSHLSLLRFPFFSSLQLCKDFPNNMLALFSLSQVCFLSQEPRIKYFS